MWSFPERAPRIGWLGWLPAVALAAACSSVTTGCRSESAPPPNVVLITIDTLRADRTSPYGYRKSATPNLEQLADEGIVFERAYANTSWTLPSLSSVMSGRYPSEHGVRSWQDSLPEQEETIAELLRAKGYRTAAIVGSYPLDRVFGLAQGFEHYDDEMTTAMIEGDGEPRPTPAEPTPASRASWLLRREAGDAFRPDSVVSDRAIEWLRSDSDEPYFLWVHYFGPHERGKRPDLTGAAREEFLAHQVEIYDRYVEETDRQVGRFLDALRADPRYPRTLVVLHSDHGQSLQEHGMFGHGFDLFETTVHVPLIARLPGGRRAGERVGGLVRNLDIFATVTELAGVRGDRPTAARDLLDADGDENDHVYLETHHLLGLTAKKVEVDGVERRVGRILRGIRTRDTKLVANQPRQVPGQEGAELPDAMVREETRTSIYDLRRDPGETNGNAQRPAQSRADLEALLARYDDGSGQRATKQLDESARERLRSLGYEP